MTSTRVVLEVLVGLPVGIHSQRSLIARLQTSTFMLPSAAKDVLAQLVQAGVLEPLAIHDGKPLPCFILSPAAMGRLTALLQEEQL